MVVFKKGQFISDGNMIVIVTRGCSKTENIFNGVVLSNSQTGKVNQLYDTPGTKVRLNKEKFEEINLNLKDLLADYLK